MRCTVRTLHFNFNSLKMYLLMQNALGPPFLYESDSTPLLLTTQHGRAAAICILQRREASLVSGDNGGGIFQCALPGQLAVDGVHLVPHVLPW